MGKPISVDLRQRVCQAAQEGLSCRQAAARFKISASSAIRWVSLLSAEGSFAPRPQGGDRKSGRIEAQAAFILARVAETPDVTLAELQTLLSIRGLDVGVPGSNGTETAFQLSSSTIVGSRSGLSSPRAIASGRMKA